MQSTGALSFVFKHKIAPCYCEYKRKFTDVFISEYMHPLHRKCFLCAVLCDHRCFFLFRHKIGCTVPGVLKV